MSESTLERPRSLRREPGLPQVHAGLPRAWHLAAAEPISPLQSLGLAARQRSPVEGDGVVVSELADLGCIVLRGHAAEPALMAVTAEVLGATLPTEPLSLRSCRAGVLLWISPDEWLLVCRRSLRDVLLQTLGAATARLHAQVADTTGGQTLLRLAGRDHLRLLRHLGPYDFEGLRPGRCVGTVVSKATVTVVRSDAQGVVLIFRRSFADHVWRLIERAARPYGLCITPPGACADPLFTPLLAPA